MFFCAGLYGAGLTVYHLDWACGAGLPGGAASGLVLSLGIVGAGAAHHRGRPFLIVTLIVGRYSTC